MKRDLTGQKFGKLLVVKCLGENLTPGRVGSNGRPLRFFGYKYLCLCDCGKEHVALNTDLERKDGKGTLTCGCSNEEKLKYMRSCRKGGQLDSGVRQILLSYNLKWKKDPVKFSWELSFEEAKALLFMGCYYCKRVGSCLYDRSLRKNKGKLEPSGRAVFRYNGIDRKDNSKGYTLENSVTCCLNCNYAKGQLSLEEFDQWRCRIKENLPKISERLQNLYSEP
jgi:hypothetical protein